VSSSNVRLCTVHCCCTIQVKVPPLRRPAAFFGFGEPKPFSLPSATDVVPRLKQNLPHYASNYGAFYLILCTITIITSPISLMSLTLSGAGWYFVTKAGADSQQDFIKYEEEPLTNLMSSDKHCNNCFFVCFLHAPHQDAMYLTLLPTSVYYMSCHAGLAPWRLKSRLHMLVWVLQQYLLVYYY
jgi:PRA1 family protein